MAGRRVVSCCETAQREMRSFSNRTGRWFTASMFGQTGNDLSKRSKKQVNKPNANRAACVHKRMWSDFIMDLLLFLNNFGCEVTPGSNASVFDFNGNGIYDQSDFLQLLSNQPPPYQWPRLK